MRTLIFLLAALLCAPASAAEPAAYARPELLMEPMRLRVMLGENPAYAFAMQVPDRIAIDTLIDVRPRPDYEVGAIGNQPQHVDIGEWKAAFGDGTDATGWSKRLSKVIFGPDSMVVVYDDGVTPNAARAWWILKYWGVQDVRILNGGFKAWKAAGGRITKPQKTMLNYDIKVVPHPERLATAAEVMACIGAGDDATCLIDTRTTGEHTAGYIPTACHTDWQEYVDPATGKIRSAAELEELLARASFDRQRRTIAYCQSGGRASVVAFATELMGGRDVANYFGSWGEWSRLPDAPTVRPGE